MKLIQPYIAVTLDECWIFPGASIWLLSAWNWRRQHPYKRSIVFRKDERAIYKHKKTNLHLLWKEFHMERLIVMIIFVVLLFFRNKE